MFVRELVKEKRISELHIQNAQPGDSGEYVCKAETIHDNSTQRSIQLIVRGKYSKLRSSASVVSIMMVKFKIDRKHWVYENYEILAWRLKTTVLSLS